MGSARSPVLRSLNTHALPPPPHYVDDADHRLKLPVCESLSVFGFAPPEGQNLPHRSTCLVWAPHNNDLVVRRNDIWICDLDILSESSDKRLAATGRPDEEVTGVGAVTPHTGRLSLSAMCVRLPNEVTSTSHQKSDRSPILAPHAGRASPTRPPDRRRRTAASCCCACPPAPTHMLSHHVQGTTFNQKQNHSSRIRRAC